MNKKELNQKVKKAGKRNFFAEGMKRDDEIEARKRSNFMTAWEVAAELRVNIMTIYRYIEAGKLNAYKLGKEFRIERSEFERFMKQAKT